MFRKDSQDTTSAASALPDSLGISRSEFHASLSTNLALGNIHVRATPGFHSNGVTSTPGGELDVQLDLGIISLFAAAAHTLSPTSLIAEYGWGENVTPLTSLPASTTTLLRGGIGLSWKAFDVSVSAFSHDTQNPFDYIYDASKEMLTVFAPSSTISWRGVSGDVRISAYCATRVVPYGFFNILRPNYGPHDQ